MKTIEIKEDGKVIGTRYLKPISNLLVNRYDIHVDGAYYDIVKEPPYLYLDQNGNQVHEGQEIWIVNKDEKFFNGTFPIWEPFVYKVDGARPECFAIFTTKEAADKFVAEKRPFELVTEDGKVYSQEQVVYLVNKEDFDIAKMTAKNVIVGILHNNLAFTSRKAANDYIKKHKAVLSLDMIEQMLVKHWGSEFPKSSIHQHIIELVNEQFKPQ